MSDTSRKVFPLESVLALVVGKEGIDIKDLAGFIAGRTVGCESCAKAVGPFAAAWLARWYPKFAELSWAEGQSWEAFVNTARSMLGENISLTSMDGLTKNLCDKVLKTLSETYDSMAAQTAAAAALEERVRVLEPAEARASTLSKKVDELEAKIKTLNSDLGALRKQAAEFQGKVAVSHDDLMMNIKDAIKDGLKGMAIGGLAAGAVAGGEDAPAAAAEENAVPDDFGFGSSGASSDGFGF